MAFSYDYSLLPGLEEARLDALKQLTIDALPFVNANIIRSNLWPASKPITASQVLIGDPDTPQGVAKNLRICIVGGGKSDELDIESRVSLIQQGETYGTTNIVYTNILIYVDKAAVPFKDVIEQAEKIERLRARMTDVFRRWFNHKDHRDIKLESQEYNTGNEKDTLRECVAGRGYKGFFEKSFDDSNVQFGAQILHVGKVK